MFREGQHKDVRRGQKLAWLFERRLHHYFKSSSMYVSCFVHLQAGFERATGKGENVSVNIVLGL